MGINPIRVEQHGLLCVRVFANDTDLIGNKKRMRDESAQQPAVFDDKENNRPEKSRVKLSGDALIEKIKKANLERTRKAIQAREEQEKREAQAKLIALCNAEHAKRTHRQPGHSIVQLQAMPTGLTVHVRLVNGSIQETDEAS
jgi:hypothetical protein